MLGILLFDEFKTWIYRVSKMFCKHCESFIFIASDVLQQRLDGECNMALQNAVTLKENLLKNSFLICVVLSMF